MKKKKLVCLGLKFCLVLSLSACTKKQPDGAVAENFFKEVTLYSKPEDYRSQTAKAVEMASKQREKRFIGLASQMLQSVLLGPVLQISEDKQVLGEMVILAKKFNSNKEYQTNAAQTATLLRCGLDVIKSEKADVELEKCK